MPRIFPTVPKIKKKRSRASWLTQSSTFRRIVVATLRSVWWINDGIAQLPLRCAVVEGCRQVRFMRDLILLKQSYHNKKEQERTRKANLSCMKINQSPLKGMFSTRTHTYQNQHMPSISQEQSLAIAQLDLFSSNQLLATNWLVHDGVRILQARSLRTEDFLSLACCFYICVARKPR